MSQFVADRLGLSLDTFAALLKSPQQVPDKNLANQARPFALVTVSILRAMGSRYSEIASELEKAHSSQLSSTQKNKNLIQEYQPIEVARPINGEKIFQNSPNHLDQAKDTVYDYIGGLARLVPPQQALDKFYDLLCRRVAVGRPDVVASLDDVIRSKGFKQEEGLRFLNRSFYTICNPWLLDSKMAPYLEQLITLLNDLPEPAALNPLTRLLQKRLQTFGKGDYGDSLRRHMRLGVRQGFSNALYVFRKADSELYESLKQGVFCYVLGPRQVGKSSLLVGLNHRFGQGVVQTVSKR